MTPPTHGKAIVFSRPLRAELHTDVRLPALDEDGIAIRTEYSTISRGTELDLYTGQMHGRGIHSQWYPMLPGYMPVGIVTEVGSRVSHLLPGDRVIGSNLFAGFDERYCPAWAGHTDHVIFSKISHGQAAQRAVKAPVGLAPETAGLAMLAGVAWHGVKHKVCPQPGELVVVIGQGVIGIFAAQLCRLSGARVIVVDQYENRLKISQQNNLNETVQLQGPTLAQQVVDYTGGQSPDAVIEVSGEMEPFRQALALVKRYGRVQAQGMYLDAAPPDLLRTLFDKNLTVTATVGETPEMTQETAQFLADGKISAHGMITAIADPSQATEVYDAVYHRPDQYVTCAFRW